MRRNTLKRNMMLSFLLVVMILMTIALSYYYMAQQHALKKELKSSADQDITHTMRQIEVQTGQVSEFASWAMHNEDILALLSREKDDANRYDMQYHSVITQLVDQLSYRPVSRYLRAVYLVGENGLDIRSGNEASLASEDAIAQLKCADYDANHWGKITKNTTPFTVPGNEIPYCHAIQDADGRVLGQLILLFSENIFQDCYDGLLLDSNNVVQLYNGNGDMLCGQSENSDNGGMRLKQKSSVNGWQIDLLVWDTVLTQQTDTLFTTVLLFAGLLLFIAVMISWMLTRILVAPIERIISRVHRIADGQFQSVERRIEKTEMDYLENSILDMQDNILLLMEQERQREREKQQLEISILQEQMNPHFLYHTLNTIRLMATMQGKKSIATMIETLSRLLRANLSIQEQTIPVAQELDFLESYLYIQNISRKGLLRWNCDGVSRDLLPQQMPKLLLQPLAENAILHGFASKSGIGTITVSGVRKEGCMLLRMEDNGCGIEPQKLEQIRHALYHSDAISVEETAHSHGIALVNVHKRIRLHYGEAYGLTIESESGHGCCITIRLPFKDEGSESTCHPV